MPGADFIEIRGPGVEAGTLAASGQGAVSAGATAYTNQMRYFKASVKTCPLVAVAQWKVEQWRDGLLEVGSANYSCPHSALSVEWRAQCP